MAVRIERLTEAQAARLPEFRQEYYNHGNNVAPADRTRAEVAFARAYRSIGREPVPVIWVGSPLTASLAFAAIKHLSSKDASGNDRLEASLWNSLGASLHASLHDSLYASLHASLRDSLGVGLRDSLAVGLHASLHDSLYASLHDSLHDSLYASLRDSLYASLRVGLGASLAVGLHDSLYASLRDSLGVGLHDSLWVGLEVGLRDSLAVGLHASLHDSLYASLHDSLHDSLYASLRDSLWTSLGASLGASLHDSLRASLHDSLWTSLADSLGASLHDSLWTSLGASLGASLHDSLRASLGDSLWTSLADSLGASLHDSLWNSLHDSLGASLHDSLRASLGASLEASLHDSLRASLGDSKVDPIFTYWWGQQDSYWIAFYKFCSDIGVKYDANAADRLDIMHEIGLSCMWWYPRDGLIIACDRPQHIYTDERERLHNDAGPAIAFRDGWKVYAVHGVRVPAWVFEEPNRLTIDAIHAEPNAEIQRVMIERFGWDRYSAECSAEIVDHDERWGTLMRRTTQNGEPILFLRVVNRSPEPAGSFRNYILPVDARLRPIPDPGKPEEDFGEPQALTALNAVASTFGLRGNKYAKLLSAES